MRDKSCKGNLKNSATVWVKKDVWNILPQEVVVAGTLAKGLKITVNSLECWVDVTVKPPMNLWVWSRFDDLLLFLICMPVCYWLIIHGLLYKKYFPSSWFPFEWLLMEIMWKRKCFFVYQPFNSFLKSSCQPLRFKNMWNCLCNLLCYLTLRPVLHS